QGDHRLKLGHWLLDFGSSAFHKVQVVRRAGDMTTENSAAARAESEDAASTPGNGGNEPTVLNEIRVGGRLKHARLVKELTLKQVARAAGCSESLLSKVENGKAYPSLPMLHRIAAALGTNVGALLMAPHEEDSVVSTPETRTNYVVHGHGIRLERVI